MHPQRIALMLPLTVIVSLLAGCAPASVSAPSHTTTTGPTATTVPLAVPAVRLSLACSALFSDDLVSRLVDSPVTLQRDQVAEPANIDEVAARQNGTTECVWGGKNRTEFGYTQGIGVFIAPDASLAYNTNVPLAVAENPPTAVNTAGDQSEYYCKTTGELWCSAEMLVGTYWVGACVTNADESGVSVESAGGRIQQVLATIAGAVANAKRG